MSHWASDSELDDTEARARELFIVGETGLSICHASDEDSSVLARPETTVGMRFEAFTAVKIWILVFCVMPRGLVGRFLL
jgi:hypothetical protein